jgi:type IV pilus assembly protein PilA
MQNLSLKKKSLGQGMTEYIIIVALIAIAAIGVFRLFGDTARNQMAGMAQELGGQSGETAVGRAKTAAGKADQTAVTERNLGNYAGNNGGTTE